MADLRCEEILEPPSPSEAMEIHGLTPLGEPQPEVHGQQNFCTTTKDRALLEDSRVFTNMLRLENYYMPNMDHYDSLQDEIKVCLHFSPIDGSTVTKFVDISDSYEENCGRVDAGCLR